MAQRRAARSPPLSSRAQGRQEHGAGEDLSKHGAEPGAQLGVFLARHRCDGQRDCNEVGHGWGGEMKRLLGCIVLVTIPTTVRADYWPQWRGPGNHGISAETKLPLT